MTLHIAALFTHDSEGRMLRINEPDGRGGIAPRFLLGQTRKGSILRFRADVDADRQRELQEESARMPRGGDRLVVVADEHQHARSQLFDSHGARPVVAMAPWLPAPRTATNETFWRTG